MASLVFLLIASSFESAIFINSNQMIFYGPYVILLLMQIFHIRGICEITN
jgi:hypothetical protein